MRTFQERFLESNVSKDLAFQADSSRCMMEMAIKALKAEKTVCTKGTHGQIAAIRIRIEVLMINTFQARLCLCIYTRVPE